MNGPNGPSQESKILGFYLTRGNPLEVPEANAIGDALVDLAVKKTLEALADRAEKAEPGSLRAYYARVDATRELGPDAYRRSDVGIPPHALENRSCMLPPCGCNVVGGGLSKDPIRIDFCSRHREVR